MTKDSTGASSPYNHTAPLDPRIQSEQGRTPHNPETRHQKRHGTEDYDHYGPSNQRPQRQYTRATTTTQPHREYNNTSELPPLIELGIIKVFPSEGMKVTIEARVDSYCLSLEFPDTKATGIMHSRRGNERGHYR